MDLLCVLTTHTQTHTHKTKHTHTKGHKGAFGGGGYAYYLDCGEDNEMHACFQTHKIVHIKHHIYRIFFGTSFIPHKDEKKKNMAGTIATLMNILESDPCFLE